MPDAAPYTVIETPDFLASAKRHLTDEERAKLVAHVAAHPLEGDLMQGTGGARKLRWARPNEGKSGGYRVVYYHHRLTPIFLLDIFAKNERLNLSKAERNKLAAILSELTQSYLEGVSGNVRRRKKTDRLR